MYILKVLLTAVAAGITALLPLSSTGTAVLLSRISRLALDDRLMRMILLGCFAAGVLSLYKDLLRLLRALIGIVRDLAENLNTFIHSRTGSAAYGYRRILTDQYRWLLTMIALTVVVTLPIGALLHTAARFAYGNLLAVAMGFFVTGLIIFVASFIQGSAKSPKKMKASDGLIIGIFSGFAFLPGISKVAAVSSAGFLCGISRKTAVKYAYLMTLFCLGLMMLPGVYEPRFGNSTLAGPGGCIAAALAAFVGCCLTIRMGTRLISKRKSRMIALINVAFGVLTVAVYLLG